MNTSVWGSSAWRLMHSVTFTYPKNPSVVDKQHYKQFFESLCYVLPCQNCCFNFQKELNTFDLDSALQSRETLSRWLFDLHNSVNERLGKKQLTYDEVEIIYNNLVRDDQSYKTFCSNHTYKIIGSGMLILGLIYYIKNNRKEF